jgi:hypothetical protein
MVFPWCSHGFPPLNVFAISPTEKKNATEEDRAHAMLDRRLEGEVPRGWRHLLGVEMEPLINYGLW